MGLKVRVFICNKYRAGQYYEALITLIIYLKWEAQ